MAVKTEIRLTGSGGQGLILAGIILAEAAITEGLNAIQTQSYGPEARGGASKAEVIISDEEIDFPKVDQADVILALTQAAANTYLKTVKNTGTAIVDASVTIPVDLAAGRILHVPIIDTAKTVLGKSIVSNIVALGFIAEYTGLVTRESVERAVLSRVPKGTEDLNRNALNEGYKLAQLSK